MNLREWAGRRMGSGTSPRAVDVLARGGRDVETGLPELWNDSIRSFYGLLQADGPRQCAGSACAFARGASLPPGTATVRCFGRCYEAPADPRTTPGSIPRRSIATESIVLRHLVPGATSSAWDDYDLPGGDEILDAVVSSGLRGRGGAAYPTGAKWRVARETHAPDRYVVANGDEGDPGAFIDRLLLEEAPHSVLAGMVACGRAIGARRGIVYVRGEYTRAADCMRSAIDEARERGVLGAMSVAFVIGAGSYVAGEETALLRSIEGGRAEPAPKPPYPAERGLGGLPTVVQNIETLSVIPWVARSRRRPVTKAFSLSGAVKAPGVVEAELGTPLARVLDEGGGGAADGKRWKLAIVGGPLGRVVPARSFDISLSFDDLPGLGHAGILVLDESVSVRAVAEHLFEFARDESCGNCAPCRIGTAHLASQSTRHDLERLLGTLERGSLCGFGQSVPRPVRDLLDAFGDEVLA